MLKTAPGIFPNCLIEDARSGRLGIVRYIDGDTVYYEEHYVHTKRADELVSTGQRYSAHRQHCCVVPSLDDIATHKRTPKPWSRV
jgi:hypothetical protein